MKISRPFLQHSAACILLVGSWRFLSQWYLFQRSGDYLLFVACWLVALTFGAGPSVLSIVRSAGAKRSLLPAILILLALPYGEWFALSGHSMRQNWTRQLFLETVFLYGILLLLHILPPISAGLNSCFEFLTRSLSRYWKWTPFFFFAATAFITAFVYHQTPLVADSAAFLFQAKILSRFHLSAPAPQLQEFFTYPGDQIVLRNGQWFAFTLPGYSALLAPFQGLDLHWFLSPVLGAFTVAGWIAYAKRWYGSNVAFWLGILMLLSPMLLVNASTILVNVPELFVVTYVIYICRAQSQAPEPWHLPVLFLLLVWAIPLRGFSILPAVLPVLIYVCWIRGRKGSFRPAVMIVSGILLGSLLLGLYQWQTTGHPLHSAYFLEYPDLRFGFGSTIAGETHTVSLAMENLSDSLLGLDYWLSGWYSGSLFFLCCFLLLLPRPDPWDNLLLIGSILLALFYFFYYFQDLIFGPRYYSFVALVILLAVARLPFLQSGPRALTPLLRALFLIVLMAAVPLHLPDFVQKCNPESRLSGSLTKELLAIRDQKAIVFLDRNVRQEFLVWNDPWMESNLIFARDLPDKNAELLKRYPGYRPLYFRMNLNFDLEGEESGYRLHSKPGNSIPGTISLFQLASAMSSAGSFPGRDFFDVCYEDLFSGEDATVQIEYLSRHVPHPENERPYRKSFRHGAIHAGILMLMPKEAYEDRRGRWDEGFDFERFRLEWNEAETGFRAAGDSGFSIVRELERVRKRIDHDDDGMFSDYEIRRFLSRKVRILGVS